MGATWLCGVRDVVAAQEGAHHEVNNVELENTRLIQRVQDLAGELARLQEASAAQATSVQATQEALRDAAVVESSLRGDLATANARAAALQQQLLQVQSQRSDQEDQHHQAAAILEAERRQSQRIVEELQVRGGRCCVVAWPCTAVRADTRNSALPDTRITRLKCRSTPKLRRTWRCSWTGRRMTSLS